MDSLGWTRMIGCKGSDERPATDFFPTPPDVTISLLDFLQLPKCMTIWEPAEGNGAMVDVIRERGYRVIWTDIVTGTDFLTAQIPDDVNMIITNPPFIAAEEFIRRANDIGLPFAFLLKSQYWHAARRLNLFETVTPDYVLPLTWRPDFSGKGASMMDVMWCVWLKHGTRGGAAIYLPLRRPKGEIT